MLWVIRGLPDYQAVQEGEEDGWSEPEAFLPAESVMWDVKVRGDIAYMTTYDGAHYQEGDVFVRFWQSDNARDWQLVDAVESVYVGGVSEVAFEFDEEGNLWTVGRNEDGDSTGAGSQICFASKSDSISNTNLSKPNQASSLPP